MRLCIRTEASARIGMGHFMRCFAIAEAARRRDWHVCFAMNAPDKAVSDRAASIGAKVETVPLPLGRDADSLRVRAEDWLLIDSYAADADYIAALSARTQVAVLDDLAKLPRYDCRLLINPATAAQDMGYETLAPQAKRLLGPDYALIREEFRRSYPTPSVPFVAVMFGGSDPDNLTGACARLIRQAMPQCTLRIIAGPAHQRTDSLKALEASDPDISLYINPASVAEVTAHARLVVTAAGGTLGEVAAMGLPALALVAYDNQSAALRACPFTVMDIRGGFPPDFGKQVAALLSDDAALKAAAWAGQAVVDGRGADRVLDAMQTLARG